MAGTATATVTSRKGRGLVRVDVDLAVTSSTTIAATSIGSFFGRLVAVLTDNTAGAGTTMADTVDLLITDAATGAPIVSDLTMVTQTYYRPTKAVVDSAGAAITPATTANDLNRDIFVAGKLNVAIAGATNGDTGRVSLFIEEAV